MIGPPKLPSLEAYAGIRCQCLDSIYLEPSRFWTDQPRYQNERVIDCQKPPYGSARPQAKRLSAGPPASDIRAKSCERGMGCRSISELESLGFRVVAIDY